MKTDAYLETVYQVATEIEDFDDPQKCLLHLLTKSRAIGLSNGMVKIVDKVPVVNSHIIMLKF